MIKSHYSITDLIKLKLPCLPSSRQGLDYVATTKSWPYIEVSSRGGRGGVRREYQPPADVMELIKEKAVKQALKAPVSVAAVATGVSPSSSNVVARSSALATTATQAGDGTLKDWQKQVAEARAAILLEIDRIAAIVGREKAITKVVIMAEDGTLSEHLAALIPVANARSGRDGKRTLSRRTIYGWLASFKDGSVNNLAPAVTQQKEQIPAWAADLLAEYQQPQGVSLAWAVERIAAKYGVDSAAMYHRARRFLQKMGNVERERGRMGSRALKDIKPFVRRDSTMLWPADVYTADGHTFDSEVAHPVHGKPFRPEVTGVVDVATRKYVGWSIDLAESGLAVLDALRHACEIGGIPTTFYVDNGSGYRNALMSAPGVGMESRLGFTMTHSIAYNSQARGIIERSHQTLWVRAAQELPTYIGSKMDAQAKQKVHKITRKDIALTGSSRLLMAFNDFIQFCDEQVQKYNNKPHRSLKKVFDAQLGRQRHMTPNEAWDEGIREGADLVTITAEEARDLFRPMKEVKVLRGEVRLFNNLYFSHELTEYHGDIVRVAYDIHNANTVWIYDQTGRYICAAEFEANKRAYFPESFLEKNARKRATGRAKRLENKLEEVRQELEGAPLILENNPSPKLTDFGSIDIDQKLTVNLDNAVSLDSPPLKDIAPIAPDNTQSVRPVFFIESERYEWLMQNQDQWTDSDQQFLTGFVNSDIYTSLHERFELLGIAWNKDASIFKVAV